MARLFHFLPWINCPNHSTSHSLNGLAKFYFTEQGKTTFTQTPFPPGTRNTWTLIGLLPIYQLWTEFWGEGGLVITLIVVNLFVIVWEVVSFLYEPCNIAQLAFCTCMFSNNLTDFFYPPHPYCVYALCSSQLFKWAIRLLLNHINQPSINTCVSINLTFWGSSE